MTNYFLIKIKIIALKALSLLFSKNGKKSALGFMSGNDEKFIQCMCFAREVSRFFLPLLLLLAIIFVCFAKKKKDSAEKSFFVSFVCVWILSKGSEGDFLHFLARWERAETEIHICKNGFCEQTLLADEWCKWWWENKYLSIMFVGIHFSF